MRTGREGGETGRKNKTGLGSVEFPVVSEGWSGCGHMRGVNQEQLLCL